MAGEPREHNREKKPFLRLQEKCLMCKIDTPAGWKVILRNDVPDGRAIVTAPSVAVDKMGPLIFN